MMKFKRRNFIKNSGYLLAGGAVSSAFVSACSPKALPKAEEEMTKVAPMVEVPTGPLPASMYSISLAEWSFHKALFAKEFTNLDFAAKTRALDIDGIEYVNQFFKDKAEDTNYLNQLNQRAADNGVTQVLIMVDGEGGLGSLKDKDRMEAVEKHYRWVNAAKYLGCHSIRVNAFGVGTREEVAEAAVDGLGKLSEYAAKENINVIVENHGGWSSDGKWLSGVMAQVGMDNCGTLPDFGNFCVERENGKPWGSPCVKEYDRYQGVKELMPYAKAVSAKTNDFDSMGNETNTDYVKMMKIVKDNGYDSFVGIEYEGQTLSETEGIIATRDLLLKTGWALHEQSKM